MTTKKAMFAHGRWRDLRLGWRSWMKRPFAAAAVIFVLALGMGTSTGIWSAVDSLWLRPLPYPDADRLVLFWETHRQVPGAWRVASLHAALAWQEEVDGLEALAWSHMWGPVLGGGELKSLRGARVSAGFFSVLGVEPLLGRDFTPEDDRPGAPPVVILSHDLWQREWGGDPSVLGRLLPLEGDGNRYAARVIGILPPGIDVASPVTFEPAEIWRPLAADPGRAQPGQRYFRVIGRLAAGASLEQVEERLAAVDRRLAEEYPEAQEGWSSTVSLVREEILAPRRPALAAFLVAVGLFFLLALSNAALLLLALAVERRRETAVRQALGARPIDLAGQRFLEGLLVAGTAACAGLGLAYGAVRPGLALGLAGWFGGREGAIDARAVLFASALVLATAVFFTILPAARGTRRDLAGDLRDGGPRAGGGGQGGIVVVQVALTFVLLVTAALLVQSFARLSRVDPGFDSDRVLTVGLRIPSSIRPGASDADRTWRHLLERIEALPGVRSAALVNHLPMRGQSMSTRAVPVPADGSEPVRVELRGVSGHYFRCLGIPLLAGRGFSSNPASEPAEGESRGVVVSESAAKVLWPGEEAAGRRLVLDWETSEPQEVLGVVADVRHDGLSAGVRPAVYLPFDRVPRRSMTLVVSSAADPAGLAIEVRARIRDVDRGLVIEELRPLSQVVETTISARRGYTLILVAFAVGALCLAAAGIYGTVVYSVARRRRELGVRLALGASPKGLVRMVVGRELRHALAGIALGLAATLLASRLISRLLYGVSASDLGTFAGISALTLAVVFVAGYLPARHAAGVDPARTLRQR